MFFSLCHGIHTGSGAHSALVNTGGTEAHPHLVPIEVKNAWRYTSSFPLRLLGVVHRYYFTFFFLPSPFLGQSETKPNSFSEELPYHISLSSVSSLGDDTYGRSNVHNPPPPRKMHSVYMDAPKNTLVTTPCSCRFFLSFSGYCMWAPVCVNDIICDHVTKQSSSAVERTCVRTMEWVTRRVPGITLCVLCSNVIKACRNFLVG
jgi:hypothetical protein